MKSRRPLIGLVLFVLSGTLCGLTSSTAPVYPAVAGFMLILGAVILLRRSQHKAYPELDDYRPRASYVIASNILILLAALFISWSAAAIRTDDAESLPTNTKLTVDGIIVDDPSSEIDDSGSERRWRYALRVNKYRTDDPTSWQPVNQEIAAFWTTPLRKWPPRYGDRWQLRGNYRANTNSPTGGIIWVDRYGAKFISKGNGSGFTAWCYDGRRQASGYLSEGLSDFPNQAALLQALVLGYRRKLPTALKTQFAASGTLHIFAISGLHVGMVAMLIIFVLNAFRVSRVRWVLFLAPLLITYAVATGARASAVRACIMAIVFFAAPFLRRKSDSLSALALAALLILAVKPEQLLNIGFIYSFVVVTGLILLYPVLLHAGKRLFRIIWPESLGLDPLAPDPDMVDEEQARTLNIRRAVMKTADYFVSLLSISCAAWLASAPLTAYFFGRFSPISILGNLLVIPLTFLIVLSGSLSLVFGSLWIGFSDIFNHASLVLISILTEFIGALTRIPYGSVEVGRVSGWIIPVWYGVLALAVVLSRSRDSRNSEE